MKQTDWLHANAENQTSSRGKKWEQRWRAEGWRALPGWGLEWVYWNAQLNRFPTFEQLFDRYLLSKRQHKYGITSPIVIYQMGKVGSTALQHSLTSLGLDVPIYQMHALNRLEEAEAWARTVPDPAADLALIRRARYVRRAIDSKRWKQVRMITLVRAPGPQLLSAFFQRITWQLPKMREYYQHDELTPQEVADYFARYFHPPFPGEWFDVQLREPFGIDVYASEFPKAQGYQYYERDTIQLVVLRLEDLSRCGATVMREFLGIPDFRMSSANVGVEKQYGELYREVQKVLRLSPERANELNSLKYAQHFYTPQELEASVARWTIQESRETV
ncbi:MAG TPA: putative capsular polysaccharide synthesis family protein [Anaerolineae bacterium]|nr:putative capsular polysaccharide synthesis family protein [Anaerolineae bacterium]